MCRVLGAQHTIVSFMCRVLGARRTIVSFTLPRVKYERNRTRPLLLLHADNIASFPLPLPLPFPSFPLLPPLLIALIHPPLPVNYDCC